MVVSVENSNDSFNNDLENEEETTVLDSVTEEEFKTEISELSRYVKKYSEARPALIWPVYSRLQKLIPSVSIKENVTQLDIILEAIRYIDNLTYKLAVDGEDEAAEET